MLAVAMQKCCLGRSRCGQRVAEWLLLKLLLVCCLQRAIAVVPSGEIQLQSSREQHLRLPNLLAAPSSDAAWGSKLPTRDESPWRQMNFLNPGNAQACQSIVGGEAALHTRLRDRDPDLTKSILVADRGNCSFLDKAHNVQQAGAKALIVRETRQDIYLAIQRNRNGSNESEAGDDLTARPNFDYDCSKGQSFVRQLASPVWDTDDLRCNSNASCLSNMCVLTGQKRASDLAHEVCCMWDTFVIMGANLTQAKDLHIPVVFVTVKEGKELENALVTYSQMRIRIFERPLPTVDLASIVLWAIGVATACCGAYYSAIPDRNRLFEDEERDKDHHKRRSPHQRDEEDLTWNVDAAHAIGFILCAGGFLTLFYFIKFNGIIPIVFGLSGLGALSQVLLTPLVLKCAPSSKRLVVLSWFDGEVMVAELVGLALGSVVVVIWYLHRREYWVLQDMLGVLLCFLFLRVVQIPSLRVASILLSLAFVYDIFFVFISPFVFGSSVMEDVATGGPAAHTRDDYPGVDFCERYPTFKSCLDPEPMPMLLVMPRILDWIGGSSMLGLGDIILPGLLLSFALRFDYSQQREAKTRRLKHKQQPKDQSNCKGYYPILCVGYAVGLAMANVAVNVMQMGQPALMYLVPCTLGSMWLVGWHRGELDLLLKGFENDEDQLQHSQIRSNSAENAGEPPTNEHTGHSDGMPLLAQR